MLQRLSIVPRIISSAMNDKAAVKNVFAPLFFLKSTAPASPADDTIHGVKNIDSKWMSPMSCAMAIASASSYLVGNNTLHNASTDRYMRANARGNITMPTSIMLTYFSVCETGSIRCAAPFLLSVRCP